MTIEEESMHCKVHRAGSRVFMAALAAALLVMASPVRAEEDVWPTLKQTTFGDRAIQAEDGKIVLDAPTTAEDASLVRIRNWLLSCFAVRLLPARPWKTLR
jgi:hypothetical protein